MYYCFECSQEDKHDHKSIAVVSELKAQHRLWTAFITEITAALSAAESAYREQGPLIVYLEVAMM